MKIDKWTIIEKAFLRSSDELDELKIEGIYWIHNSLLRSQLVIKTRDPISGKVEYIPFEKLDIRSVHRFTGEFSFIERSETLAES
jgi:hypothetical protein|tara:strand:+ start:2003 stop:2257 length:255 start_codon:yes stop_codon:yes gene_type:complete